MSHHSFYTKQKKKLKLITSSILINQTTLMWNIIWFLHFFSVKQMLVRHWRTGVARKQNLVYLFNRIYASRTLNPILTSSLENKNTIYSYRNFSRHLSWDWWQGDCCWKIRLPKEPQAAPKLKTPWLESASELYLPIERPPLVGEVSANFSG
jgi:hypothetical protein